MISVIIPVLNEEKALPRCLESVRSQTGEFEVIVADGGSEDTSREIADKFGARVIDCEPGRAKQMNKGASIATGDVLLFLHADSILPPHAFEKISAVIQRGYDGGAFSLRFEPSGIFLGFVVFWANLFMAVIKDFQGDRSIFVKREAYNRLGGVKDMELMEDVDFSVRLRRSGFKTKLLSGPVVTSSRRFRDMGVIRVTYWTIRLLIDYHLGRDLHGTAQKFYSAKKR